MAESARHVQGVIFGSLVLASLGLPSAGRSQEQNLTQLDSLKCVVEGTVKDAITHRPLAEVRVQSSQVVPTTTNAQGRFRLSGLAAGPLWILVMPPSRDYSSAQRRLSLAPGEAIKDVDFSLAPAAVLAGRVLDKAGRPVAGVQVVARPFSYLSGRLQFGYIATRTDDLGEYRLKLVGPARTYIGAELAPSPIRMRPPRSGSPGKEEAANTEVRATNVRTYYPFSPTLEGAAVIDIAAGEKREGLDIVLIQEKTVCVSAAVNNDGAWAGASLVHILVIEAIPANLSRLALGKVKLGEEFEVCGVPPGAFAMVAATTDSEGRSAYAAEEFTVGSRGIKLPPLSLAALEPVRGRMRIDSVEKDRPVPRKVQVVLQQKDKNGMPFVQQNRATVEPGGGFVVSAVARDEYWLDVRGLTGGLYVKSGTLNGQDVWRHPLRVGTGDIEISLGEDGASLSGSVVDKEGRPEPGASVLLALVTLPTVLAPTEMQTVAADQHGQFEFSGLPPGEYMVLATSDDLMARRASAAWFREHQSKAAKVVLGPNGTNHITLRDMSTQ